MTPPLREVRAHYDATTVTVYQAYSSVIAGPAVQCQTVVEPFKMGRMTWIKPSFTWMMYRSSWASKPGQERVLAIRLLRDGFDDILAAGCLSHFDADVHESRTEWEQRLAASSVRVQWDPERHFRLQAMPWRAIQIGLTGDFVQRYVREWISEIVDITELVHRLQTISDGEGFPKETRYPVPADVEQRLGMAGGSATR